MRASCFSAGVGSFLLRVFLLFITIPPCSPIDSVARFTPTATIHVHKVKLVSPKTESLSFLNNADPEPAHRIHFRSDNPHVGGVDAFSVAAEVIYN